MGVGVHAPRAPRWLVLQAQDFMCNRHKKMRASRISFNTQKKAVANKGDRRILFFFGWSVLYNLDTEINIFVPHFYLLISF
jgi:hypothetical protein